MNAFVCADCHISLPIGAEHCTECQGSKIGQCQGICCRSQCHRAAGHGGECRCGSPLGKEHLIPGQSMPEQRPAYGHCPHCGSKGVWRERRPDGNDGNDRCEKGHVYPSKAAK